MIFCLKILKNSIVQFSILLILMGSCANPLSPTGGPKDESAPEIIRSIPDNQSTNFKDNIIVLYFNEYINLKDITTQLIISPPVQKTPEFRVRGKSLIIEFDEQWRDETTYNIFFGDAIVDITENNPIPGYKFTFSTGDYLDSLMIQGKVINAFNLLPVKGAYVMLYDSIYDSVPYKHLPYYIARTADNGDFMLTNLRNIPYLLFGLTDLNANYLFDNPNEEISFIDTLVTPWFDKSDLGKGVSVTFGNDSATQKLEESNQVITDSIETDIVILGVMPNDSIIAIDSISMTHSRDTTVKSDSLMISTIEGRNFQLFHFKEVDSTQQLLKTQLLRKNVLNFQFKVPVKNPQFEFLDGDNTHLTYLESNRTKDTLTMWLPEYDNDSIKLKVSDEKQVLDTIEMSVKPREKANKDTGVSKLNITNNIKSSRLKPNSSLYIYFNDPIKDSNLEEIVIKEDTINLENIRFEFGDSIKRHIIARYPWKEGVLYSVIIPDSILTGIMGTKNDSTNFSFMGLKEEETAILSINIDLPEDTPYIIQLLDSKEKIIMEYRIAEDLTINIPYITPGKYKLKAIDDRNGNGYWDTGKFLTKQYPERVLYYQTELELRANWSLDETWKIPEPGK